jgi:hypothetical protein
VIIRAVVILYLGYFMGAFTAIEQSQHVLELLPTLLNHTQGAQDFVMLQVPPHGIFRITGEFRVVT